MELNGHLKSKYYAFERGDYIGWYKISIIHFSTPFPSKIQWLHHLLHINLTRSNISFYGVLNIAISIGIGSLIWGINEIYIYVVKKREQ